MHFIKIGEKRINVDRIVSYAPTEKGTVEVHLNNATCEIPMSIEAFEALLNQPLVLIN